MSQGLIADYQAAEHEEIQKLRRKVCNGKCATFEDYKARCAEIAAHERALELFSRAVEKYFKSEEQDNLEQE